MNLSSSSLNPYSARAPLTSDLHLSTFSPYGESTSITVGVGSAVGNTVGTRLSIADTTEAWNRGLSRSRFLKSLSVHRSAQAMTSSQASRQPVLKS